ncbi:MAG: hypothetical protein V3S89_08865 [Desulfobacterales bacterium]
MFFILKITGITILVGVLVFSSRLWMNVSLLEKEIEAEKEASGKDEIHGL